MLCYISFTPKRCVPGRDVRQRSVPMCPTKQKTSQESPVVASGNGEKDKQQQVKITLVGNEPIAGILKRSQTNPWNKSPSSLARFSVV